ncbi:hypothetical protein ACJX0J_014025 [Zea mays]
MAWQLDIWVYEVLKLYTGNYNQYYKWEQELINEVLPVESRRPIASQESGSNLVKGGGDDHGSHKSHTAYLEYIIVVIIYYYILLYYIERAYMKKHLDQDNKKGLHLCYGPRGQGH